MAVVGVQHNPQENKTPPVRARFCMAGQASYNRSGFTRPKELKIVIRLFNRGRSLAGIWLE